MMLPLTSPPDQPSLIGTGDSPAVRLEAAITTIVRWSTRHDVQSETMRRARCAVPTASIWLLVRIATCGPVHPSELAVSLGVDNSTITPRLQRLERDCLVAREPDPDDRRAALVRITPAGAKLLKRLRNARREMFEELLSDWSWQQQSKVADAAAEFAAQLEGRQLAAN